MKKYLLITLVGIALVANLFVSFDSNKKVQVPKFKGYLVLEKYVYANEYLAKLDFSEQVGQRLIISIPGTSLDESTEELLSMVKPGGIILFSSNIQSEDQVIQLTEDLQKWASDNHLPPFFIGVDEEGGVVERIWFSPVEKAQPELGSINDEVTTRENAEKTAATLKKLGINMNFAPVADIAYSGDSVMLERSFGSDANLVANHTSWIINEFEKNGIAAVAKHFPGHGRTPVDSHNQLPSVNVTKEEWLKSDGFPFIKAVDGGGDFIMSGHLIYPAISPDITSQSSTWLNEILRNDLGFDGVVISDDIKMGAAGNEFSATAIQCLSNGNDMIIVVLNKEDLLEVVNQSYSNSHSGKADLSVKRILVRKFQYLRQN